MSHEEVLVKVNAWVDRGLADLVRALNRFERVETVAGCENVGDADREAVVEFRYGESWEDTVRFCLWLADELHARLEEGAWVSVSCRAHRQVAANLHVSPSRMEIVVAELDAIANRWDPEEEIKRIAGGST